MRRKFILFGIDLFWVAISPFAALFIRDNFEPRGEALSAAIVYAAIGVLVGAIVLPLAGLNRGLWRYTSLTDLLRLTVGATAIVLISLFVIFAFSRLEDISRSLPVIQWFFLIAAMAGTRLAVRILQERKRSRPQDLPDKGDTQNVLLVGVNQIAELYLRCVDEFAAQRVFVVGILASGTELPGRLLRSHKVLGQPKDLADVVRQLEVHGAPLDRVVVAEPPGRLSPAALEALLELERSSTIKIDWLQELVGLGPLTERSEARGEARVLKAEKASSVAPQPSMGGYRRVKRFIDLFGAVSLTVVLAPIAAVVAALCAFDVGLPVIFWQKRPGRYGRSFNLYKFRTMRGAHDLEGNRIPDDERSSKIGVWLRRTRLDELPQLYNILVGEMSFVGPRPLLPCDQPDDITLRVSVRPGLTGLAQVYGDRTMKASDKNALDICYVQNASLWLDAKIILRTVLVFVRGERLDLGMLEAARSAIGQFNYGDAGRLLPSKVGEAKAESLHSAG